MYHFSISTQILANNIKNQEIKYQLIDNRVSYTVQVPRMYKSIRELLRNLPVNYEFKITAFP